MMKNNQISPTAQSPDQLLALNMESLKGAAKMPRTARGRATMQKLLDAAAQIFGEKGFHEASISDITRKAGTAMGSFYTYFESKDAIFRALVSYMSAQVASHASMRMADSQTALEREKNALYGFLEFTQSHQEIYNIIDKSKFVDPERYRDHYKSTAKRIFARLQDGAKSGELRDDMSELHAWAVMGMNVFIGLRYGIWAQDDEKDKAEAIADKANDFLANGLAKS